jgi:hypothetical protein
MGIYRAERDAPRFARSDRKFAAGKVDRRSSGGHSCRFAAQPLTAEIPTK